MFGRCHSNSKSKGCVRELRSSRLRVSYTKRKQMGITRPKMCWLLGRKSKLATSNNILIYRQYSNQSGPIQYNCGVRLPLRTELLERFQSKALSMIVDASWYVPNTFIWRDLQTPTVKEEIRHYSSQYSARHSVHSNDMLVNLMGQPDNRRLRRHLPKDLPTRF
jgi:hypothetical protein